MAARFPDPRVFRVKVGGNGLSVFGHLWDNSDASGLHGTVAWVGNGLFCCAQVDLAWFDDEGPLAMMPFFVFIREKQIGESTELEWRHNCCASMDRCCFSMYPVCVS